VFIQAKLAQTTHVIINLFTKHEARSFQSLFIYVLGALTVMAMFIPSAAF